MGVFSSVAFSEHEQVVHVCEPVSGLRGIIAVHSTALGPGLGGCRILPYQSDDAALRDALRLSEGMTYKAAIAGLPFGGAKMVVIADAAQGKSGALLRALGAAVERLNGDYITGEDVGTTAGDMAEIRKTTANVFGLPSDLGGSGDPSASTALGCFVGIEAAVRHRFGRKNLNGVRIAVQGLGNVGWNLCRLLTEAGAKLVVTDVRAEVMEKAVTTFKASSVSSEKILDADVDVLAPCALGAVINDETLPKLKAAIIAGGANNQLADEARHGLQLRQLGILYAPDYVVNSGGLIQLAMEHGGIFDRVKVEQRVRAIGGVLSDIFESADKSGLAPNIAARELAKARLSAAEARAA